MKRIITCLTALLLAALCGTGLTEVKGKYTWKGEAMQHAEKVISSVTFGQ